MAEPGRQTQAVLPDEAGPDAMYWLGQAGFWIDLGGIRFLIDPYLSDSLARKYAGTRYPHVRMMPVPVAPSDLPRPDIVLITHAHTDHMDADTLGAVAARFPGLRFVVPAAEEETARTRIGPEARLDLVTSGDQLDLGAGVITVFPSAHEARKKDAAGRDHFLGYGIACADTRLYHSGDTVPFDSLAPLLRRYRPDIALLPVNGRDEVRAANGVPGNMTMREAIALCQDCAIPRLIPHHFGLFAFNTASEEDLLLARKHQPPPRIELPLPLTPIPLASPGNNKARSRE